MVDVSTNVCTNVSTDGTEPVEGGRGGLLNRGKVLG